MSTSKLVLMLCMKIMDMDYHKVKYSVKALSIRSSPNPTVGDTTP